LEIVSDHQSSQPQDPKQASQPSRRTNTPTALDEAGRGWAGPRRSPQSKCGGDCDSLLTEPWPCQLRVSVSLRPETAPAYFSCFCS